MRGTSGYPLHPLTIGEIFDRAVTIYVRNFAVFTLMILVLLAPLALVQYFALPSQDSLAQVMGQVSHPQQTPAMPFSGAQLAAIFGVVLFALIFAPFANNAVALGVARLYNGETPGFRDCYRAVFKRWLPLLGTAWFNVLLLVGLYLAGVVGLVLVVTIGILLVKTALPISVAVFAVGVLAGLAVLAVLVLFIMFFIAYAFAMYSTSIEELGPVRATMLAYSRIFNRREFTKALLMALAYLGLQFGALIVTMVLAVLLTALLPFTALQLAINALAGAVAGAFITVLLAVYYYDIRTRSEGLDLETDLKRLTEAL